MTAKEIDELFGPEPTLLQKAANFAGAALGHALNGGKLATKQVIAARIALCQACDLRTPANTCRHPACGCQLAIKQTWESERCPIGKW